jgi:hypothetical protein
MGLPEPVAPKGDPVTAVSAPVEALSEKAAIPVLAYEPA